MSMELTLVGDLLMVSESDRGAPEAECPWPRAHEAAIERMVGALKAGTISEAELVEWMCLRLRVAEARGDGATA
jgi:hypothetical protein